MQKNNFHKIQVKKPLLKKFAFLFLWMAALSFAYEEVADSFTDSLKPISSKNKASRLSQSESMPSVQSSSSIALLANESPTVSVTYSQVNSEIFSPKCLNCHGANGQLPNLSSYSSFATNTRYIRPGNASGSLLYQMIQSGMMPQDGPPLSQSEIDSIGSWINDGAQNN